MPGFVAIKHLRIIERRLNFLVDTVRCLSSSQQGAVADPEQEVSAIVLGEQISSQLSFIICIISFILVGLKYF